MHTTNLEQWYLLGDATAEAWYGEARALCKSLADKYHLDLEAVAGFIALLSPRVKWADQLRLTDWAIAHVLSGGDLSQVSCALGYYSNRRKAQAWLQGSRWAMSVKVSCFYANIMGDENPVTLDVWATRAALQGPQDPEVSLKAVASALKRKGSAEHISAAYAAVAARYNTTPARVQARVWVAIRQGA